MRRTPWTRLLVVALVAAAVVLLVLRFAEARGATVLAVPWLSAAVLVVIAVLVLASGWQVRQLRDGKRPGMDPLRAARTVVLATASAYTGALLAGWYGGHVLLTVGDLEIAARRDVAVTAGVALAAAVLLAVVGLVVERWCEVRDGDDEDGTGPTVPDGVV
ncbi:DUF3180 domain-containing protein [Cellulomonas carbonis]|uniref:DUF3180 domain-containing protein n=1 Tax=Cellulomonas carbonis T26 TaxID=947969 RepID=A0A0A0BNL1_9CELL|nr:DUF3180 domain-containing protein [Cellulomonas carbonis]KGM08654.1 hypothetical protein N868_10225 [Cellulomonas carbonis T26]GGC04923.1 membrane protein [Cellulomonas carbonis]